MQLDPTRKEIAKHFEEHLRSGEHYLRVNQRIFMLSSALIGGISVRKRFTSNSLTTSAYELTML
jgi:hypothetical protein